MTSDLGLQVNRCTVTVRRRSGWSWGDPEELLAGVLAAVEDALEVALHKAGIQPGENVVVTEPVRLVVGRDGTVTAVTGTESLTARLMRSHDLQAHSPAGREADQEWVDPPPPAELGLGEMPVLAVAPTAVQGGLLAAVQRLFGGGALAGVLAAGGSQIQAEWLRVLEAACAAAEHPQGPRAWSREALESVAGRVLSTSEAARLDVAGRVLLVASALIAAAEGQPPSGETIALLRRRQPIDGPPNETADVSDRTDAVGSGSRSVDLSLAARSDPAAPSVSPTPAPAGPLRRSVATIVPALPFLVLLQVQRLDYLGSATAVLHVAGNPEAGLPIGGVGADRALAAMLAGKALVPPARGWRRERAEREAVALASGLAVMQVDELLDRWAAPTRDSVPMLDALLSVLPARHRDRSADAEEALAAHLGLPGRDERRVEAHLAKVVATALDELALELWGEQADGLLALRRLEDLEVRVVVNEREVSIGLPRGQRWLDLRRIGLLDVWKVPWASGGRWELVTW